MALCGSGGVPTTLWLDASDRLVLLPSTLSGLAQEIVEFERARLVRLRPRPSAPRHRIAAKAAWRESVAVSQPATPSKFSSLDSEVPGLSQRPSGWPFQPECHASVASARTSTDRS